MDFSSLFSGQLLGQGINPNLSGTGINPIGGTGLQAPANALMPNNQNGLLSPAQAAIIFRGLNSFGGGLANRNVAAQIPLSHSSNQTYSAVSPAQMLASRLMR